MHEVLQAAAWKTPSTIIFCLYLNDSFTQGGETECPGLSFTVPSSSGCLGGGMAPPASSISSKDISVLLVYVLFVVGSTVLQFYHSLVAFQSQAHALLLCNL